MLFMHVLVVVFLSYVFWMNFFSYHYAYCLFSLDFNNFNSQGLRASPQSGFSFLSSRMLGSPNDLRQVEAKYPALLFKQQLTAFLEKIYGMIRDNLKKNISPLISLCIQVCPLFPMCVLFHEISKIF